jgi:hypothetical protein
VTPTLLRLAFQGGFAGKECELFGTVPTAGSAAAAAAATAEGAPKPVGGVALTDTVKLGEIWPVDDSTLQEFVVPCATPITQLRIMFNSTTDFFGRVTVYTLEIEGSE